MSETIRSIFKEHRTETEFEIQHVIQPNGDFDATKGDERGMAFESKYYELNENNDKFLRESGFREPVVEGAVARKAFQPLRSWREDQGCRGGEGETTRNLPNCRIDQQLWR